MIFLKIKINKFRNKIKKRNIRLNNNFFKLNLPFFIKIKNINNIKYFLNNY